MKKNKSLLIDEPAKEAAGLKAIFISIRQITQRMSILKTYKVLTTLNQKKGIDCPGCAWPDPDHRSKLGEFCENGIKAIAEEAMDNTTNPAFFARYSLKQLQNQTDYWLGQQGRLTHPMIIKTNETHYTPISWENAYNLIGKELKDLDDPNKAAFYFQILLVKF